MHIGVCLPDPKWLFYPSGLLQELLCRPYVGETGRKFGLRIKEHKKEVDSFTAGTQT